MPGCPRPPRMHTIPTLGPSSPYRVLIWPQIFLTSPCNATGFVTQGPSQRPPNPAARTPCQDMPLTVSRPSWPNGSGAAFLPRGPTYEYWRLLTANTSTMFCWNQKPRILGIWTLWGKQKKVSVQQYELWSIFLVSLRDMDLVSISLFTRSPKLGSLSPLAQPVVSGQSRGLRKQPPGGSRLRTPGAVKFTPSPFKDQSPKQKPGRRGFLYSES